MSTALGVRIENGRPVIDPAEQTILGIVEEQAAAGRNGREIAESLNRRGFRTRTGTEFNRHNVAHYLKARRKEKRVARAKVHSIIAAGQAAGKPHAEIAAVLNQQGLRQTNDKPFTPQTVATLISRKNRKKKP